MVFKVHFYVDSNGMVRPSSYLTAHHIGKRGEKVRGRFVSIGTWAANQQAFRPFKYAVIDGIVEARKVARA